MSKKISKIWHSDYYIVNVQPGGKRKATCRFCQAKSYTENASKMQDHILQCEKVDEETKSHFGASKRLRQSKVSTPPPPWVYVQSSIQCHRHQARQLLTFQ
jgi:hypothetical protein